MYEFLEGSDVLELEGEEFLSLLSACCPLLEDVATGAGELVDPEEDIPAGGEEEVWPGLSS